MHSEQPSQTALIVAALRAAHQALDGGSIFSDPLARRILGSAGTGLIRQVSHEPLMQLLRLFVAIRARFAEDALAAALGEGCRQIIVLGAGLDTYAYRAERPPGVRVFEVDHPATQAWKRRLLAEASIPVAAGLAYVPADLEREPLPRALAAAGFDERAPSFVSWLGVVPYLSEPAISSTLSFISKLSGGVHVVFDYVNPAMSIQSSGARAMHESVATRVAALGEALLSSFETSELAIKLERLGLRVFEDLAPTQFIERYLASGVEIAEARGVHLIHCIR